MPRPAMSEAQPAAEESAVGVAEQAVTFGAHSQDTEGPQPASAPTASSLLAVLLPVLAAEQAPRPQSAPDSSHQQKALLGRQLQDAAAGALHAWP